MPAINLPAINITESDLNSKESMNQILDTLQKYRKELNFLLMNLDIDNMPIISERIENIEGDYSILQQSVDGISMEVGNIQGDVSTLTLTTEGLQSTVSSHSTQLESQSTQITQLSNSINLKATVGDVVNYLNINQTGVQINASNIDLTGVTTLYSQTSGRYARYNALGDFVLYESNSEIFSVYNTFGGGVALTFFGDSFIAYHDVTELIYPQGTWDFSDAEVTGLSLKWA